MSSGEKTIKPSLGPLPPYQRLITGTNKDGKAVLLDEIKDEAEFDCSMDSGKVGFSLTYTTSEFPAQLNGNKDVEAYKGFLVKPPGIVNPNGTLIRVVDFTPGMESPMHRTVSIDYGVVLFGKFELELDSGEKRTMSVGDVCVQRSTMHLWRNVSTDNEGYGRMLFVLTPCHAIEHDGKKLGEDYGSMTGVRPSH